VATAESQPATWSGTSPAEIVTAAGAEDLFVLRRVAGDRFAHLGGAGRGAGWAGIVEIDEHELLELTAGEGVARRTAPVPTQMFGPYYAHTAAFVRVSHDVVVVFGGSEAIAGTDDELVELGRFVAETLVEVAPAKRLADELEVLTALQAFLQAPPETLADALQRLADHATRALSCEVGIAYLSEQQQLATCDLRGGDGIDRQGLLAAAAELTRRGEFPKCVQRNSADDLPRPVSSTDGIIAYYLLEITRPSSGILLLLHTTAGAPRGFTALCQSLGAQLVEAAEPLLVAAGMRDRMRSDLDRAQSDARRDQLTGLANRLAWDEAIAATAPHSETPAAVVMVDGSGLKAVNDMYGHEVGDELLCAIADALGSCVREGDVVARLGGDEFGLLLDDADEAVTAAIVTRIEATIAAVRLSNGLGIWVATGFACEQAGDLVTAQRLADARMLQAKRDHRASAARTAT
jgi:diguanylate cyclase (GGDEF)-like protein